MLKFKNFLDFEDFALDLLKAKDYKKFYSINSSKGNVEKERFVLINKENLRIGVVISERYYSFCYDNDIDVPASISLYHNTDFYYINSINYIVKGNYHRPFQPANLVFDEKYLILEKYYMFNKLHNTIGPAYRYKDNNNVWNSLFYLNGKLLTRDTFFKNIKNIT